LTAGALAKKPAGSVFPRPSSALAILDRTLVKNYDQAGAPERLILEKFADHPELEGESQMTDIFEPDLEMYYRLPSP